MERWEARYVTPCSQATSVLLRGVHGGGSAQSSEMAASFECQPVAIDNEQIVSELSSV
jgi:hypothetical protein